MAISGAERDLTQRVLAPSGSSCSTKRWSNHKPNLSAMPKTPMAKSPNEGKIKTPG
jgi:hypothetical protein